MAESKTTFTYIDAVKKPVATRICKYLFGESFDRLEQNNEEKTYDVFLIKPVDEEKKKQLNEDTQDFNDYWGARYRFFFVVNK